MYICLCNGVKEKDIACAIESGACSVAQVYRQLGCQPQCGKCAAFIRENYLQTAETQ